LLLTLVILALPSLKIQVASDLHCEFFAEIDRIKIEPSADVLCLAGDIGIVGKRGTYEALLKRESEKFKQVFVILGNRM